MIICFDCDAKTKVALDDFLKSGQFRGYSEVIAVAIANLLVLREQVLERGAVVITSSDSVSQQMQKHIALVKPDEEALPPTNADSPRGEKVAARGVNSVNEGIPTIFRSEHMPNCPTIFAKPPLDGWKTGQKIRLDKWIFGQYNKLLPAKASCRALVNLIGNKRNGVMLSAVAAKISEEAAVLGDFLAAHDHRHELRRDDALRTGFPHTTVNADGTRVTNNGQLRYANQFVAGASSKGIASGLLIDLKLINCGGPDLYIQLTNAGWRFASLKNPVLDQDQTKPAQKFSDEEVGFLLDHIRVGVPVEDFAYRTLLAAILDGADNPEKLNSALKDKDIWWQGRNPSMTLSFLSSQRSGAVSRMTDLGLVEREREGTRVTYRVTTLGRDYLKRSGLKKRRVS